MIGQPLLESHVAELGQEFEGRSAEDVIRWALDTFGARIAISTSFQVEGMVVLDIAHRIDPNVRVLTVDTGRLPEETYDLIDRVREYYGVPIEVHYPDHDDLSSMITRHGANPFYNSVSLRLRCCEIRKVDPLKSALGNLDAWITGLRRSQSGTRANTSKVESDSAHGDIVKVNPLADWSPEEVWEYIKARDIPYNALYDQGYTSIGCAPCTRPTQPGEDPRAGRWWWETGVPKECGMHMPLSANGARAHVNGGSS